MKEYGTPDADDTAYKVLLAHVAGMQVDYIIHKPRVPVDARACQMPQSLTVQAVLADKSVITCFQPAPGKPARIK